MGIQKDINDLLKAEVISAETAEKIKAYYQQKQQQSGNRLFVVFGILGALLVGLGIILIIAHNWDDLSRTTRTIIAFIPLIMGQAACGYTILKKQDSMAWREGATTFLFLSLGACISLISQIYNIPGDLRSFVLLWMLLCVPLVYVMRSSLASLMYILGITYYACLVSYWTYPPAESFLYWLLLVPILPHYYLLYRKAGSSNFTILHNWFIPLSIVICLGTIADKYEEVMFIAYFALFGLLILIGQLEFFKAKHPLFSGYMPIGFLGTNILLLTTSFDWLWEDLLVDPVKLDGFFTSPEFIASLLLSLGAIGLIAYKLKSASIKDLNPFSGVFLVFTLLFILGHFTLAPVIIINLLILGLGILVILDGAKKDHLGILNIGLIIVTALVICRFFDSQISFVLRGIMFVTVGAGFFVTNYWMLKKRRKHEQ